MEELYFTIAGCSHYFGSDFMEKGMKVKLEKEPDNEYDKWCLLLMVELCVGLQMPVWKVSCC